MALREFKLPDPGEGLTEADIVTWHVAVGDTVKVNDVVVEVETAKSLVELPVPFAGTVSALHVAEGDTVEVGTPIITVDDGVGGASAPAAPAPAAAQEPAAPAAPASDGEEIGEGLIGGTTSTGRTAVLVGYGVKQTEAVRRPRKGAATPAPGTSPSPAPVQQSTNVSTSVRSDARPDASGVQESSKVSTSAPSQAGTGARALAKPPVRKLAKDLGVDLGSVTPTGDGGVVTRADVEAAASGASQPPAAAPDRGAETGTRETRVPVKGVRKMTAQAMVGSAFTAPHVTEWVTVDVTATMELVENLKRDREFRDVKVTPLLVLAKAMCVAVRRNPEINASWDEAAQEIVLKHYVNLGIAAATPRGLVVPNIKDADRMTMRELADAIAGLTATAREGRTQPADMSGGTLTITNVGVFGVDAGTPILNPGESAILAFGSVTRRPWVVGTGADERIEPRWVTTLALSFDHRLVDGELGSRFLADVAALLADPARGLVWG
ncbi:dihydrolipoamide acetyltransferase family protein [Phycicoccus sp. DTK01]|uniref:dihydrolipoamide acetyltransferase family protein n=1 Tax=Phycicoccus sp. DTK01 TaxID=2785745 RepID=UPI001A8E63A7|nr:dihydrolipoamide acetyltransferase family protein [Phycicoccus sp. DTK01]GIL36502.1 dihydrolipoamide acetyltransferase component of pyruvate dehydrogenase complex [Phycicoccus sp. DTK01]